MTYADASGKPGSDDFVQRPLDEQLKGFNLLFASRSQFWQAAGRTQPRICQFLVTDEPDHNWYVQLDADGGRAVRGVHENPDVVWRSSRDALDAVFSGTFDPAQVQIEGDFQTMREIFVGLS